MDDFKALIADAGRLLGLDGLEPDGEGVVEFDGVGDDAGRGALVAPASVTVQFVPDAGDMVLWSAKVLGKPVADGGDGAAALRRALEANFKSSATLSIDPDDGSLVLTDYAPLRSLSPETFVARLESFVNALVACRRKISGGSRSRATEGDTDAQERVPPTFGQPGFLAV